MHLVGWAGAVFAGWGALGIVGALLALLQTLLFVGVFCARRARDSIEERRWAEIDEFIARNNEEEN